jgi:phospholipase C
VSAIQHIFVLMLENRSFDHMLGFSGITGTDAATGAATKIIGLNGSESNSYQGQPFKVTPHADISMPVDPGHEFSDVLEQLCGAGAKYPSGGPYPAIDNSGFVSDYARSGGNTDPAEIMKCYQPDQLPVLVALAKEFAVCDNWFSSMPGSTWPNRFFVCAASCGGLDHSPTFLEMLKWETIAGFRFEHGSIFDQNVLWRIYAGGDLCFAQALKGIQFTDVSSYSDFADDVNAANYQVQFTYIEPNYGNVTSDFSGGTSQHPKDSVNSGESLIKSTYEALRRSPIWNNSMLIITWDEHGGFYDHVAPPAAVAPGDVPKMPNTNKSGFLFNQYGPRVPAVVISPLIPRNQIDHRTYDHASVPATVEAAFNLKAMTQRDAKANNLLALASLAKARTDAPMTLPSPATPMVGERALRAAKLGAPAPAATRPTARVASEPGLPGFLYVAMRSDLDLSPPERRKAILAKVTKIRTKAQARKYIEEVRSKIRVARLGLIPPARG